MNHINQYFIAYITTFFSISSLGLFVYFKDRKKKLNQIYALFSSTVACWSFFHAFLVISSNPTTALILSRFTHLGIIFIPSTYLHFVLLILDVEKEKKRKLVLVYTLSVIFLLLSFTRLLIPSVTQRAVYNYIWTPGPLYFPFVAFWFGCVIYAQFQLFKGYKESSGKRRNQLKYLFFASLIGYLGGAGNFLLIFNIEIYFYHPYGTYGVPIYTALAAYAIIVHNLLDLNIVIRKTLIYSGLISSIIVINTITVFLFENTFRRVFGYKSFPITIILASIIAITFLPLYRLITSFIDKLFFRGTLPKIADELQHSEKLAALGVLASGLAHEIKNPLAPIKTYIQNLQKNINNTQYIDKITKLIPEEIDKITGTINQLRDFANPPSLSITKVNIHNLIDKRLNLLGQDLIVKNITVEKHYSTSLPGINADPVQLERIFINLFLNAIDAMPNGGKITVATEQSNEQVLIKVSDTGIGISKEDLQYIFDPFYSKGKHHGSGLGLAITHRIIKEHNGFIKVESTKNKETTFYIYLPI